MVIFVVLVGHHRYIAASSRSCSSWSRNATPANQSAGYHSGARSTGKPINKTFSLKASDAMSQEIHSRLMLARIPSWKSIGGNGYRDLYWALY